VAGGGNITLNSYSIGTALSNSNGTRDDLVGGTNITFSGGTVANGNAVYVGTGSFTNVSFPHGNAHQGSVINFPAAGTYLQGASTFWGTLATNGTVTYQYNQYTLTGTNPNLNVFNISGANLANATNVTITAPAGSTVLINVNGTSDTLHNAGFTVNGTTREKVLLNFPTATSLNISGIAVQASILAPRAAVSFSNGNVNGNLIGATYGGSGTLGNFLFTGCLPTAP
jgi:choice-of-anchor A domain-containing protein